LKGDPTNLGFSTRAIHAGQPPEATTGAVTTPIFQTSTYVQPGLDEGWPYEYARGDNPTRAALQTNIAALEGGRSGHAFSSGMGAIATLMTLLRSGDKVVASRMVYGGTYRYITRILAKGGIESVWVNTSDLDEVRAAMDSKTRMLYVETPTNPLMGITDLAAAAEIAHAHGALLAVDNTFLTPYFQRPLELGADVVVHSATKYLNGHSDSILGLLVARRQEEGEWFHYTQNAMGAVPGPFDCFLVMRGIKTLGVRMDRHETNARSVVEMLVGHPKVRRIRYPGLPEHPGHEIQKRQATGFGGVITFDLGSLEAARRFLNRVQVMSLAESLGGVESLISHPALMTHASIPAELREEAGLTDGLVRVSVGIEDLADLLADFEQALEAV